LVKNKGLSKKFFETFREKLFAFHKTGKKKEKTPIEERKDAASRRRPSPKNHLRGMCITTSWGSAGKPHGKGRSRGQEKIHVKIFANA